MAAQGERTENEPLVGTEAPDPERAAKSSRPPSWTLRRSRVLKVAAVVLLGALGLSVAAIVPGSPHRMVRRDKADAGAVTGLDVVSDGRVLLQVGTSTQAFAETASSVSVSFLVGGVWTGPQELFESSREGEVHTVSAAASQCPTAVRLKINGNDGWGYRFVRMSFGGVTLSLLDTPNGKPYGNNGFWLDGNQKLQHARVFQVPSRERQTTGRSDGMRWFMLVLLLLGIAGLVAYYFRDFIRRFLAVWGLVPPDANMGQAPAFAPPMASHNGLLQTGPLVPAAGLQSQQVLR